MPVLRGQVRLDRLDGAPLAGVSVLMGEKVVAATDAEGRFVIRWPRPSPAMAGREAVTLQLSRPGEAMAVVNDVLLTWPASLATSPAPVTLLVSAPETVTTWREFHLGHLALRTSTQSLDATIAAERARLRSPDSHDEYFMVIANPQDQQAGTWALLADKGPAAQMPALYRQALHAWWRGEPAQALQGLSLDVLQRAQGGTPAAEAGLAQAWMLRTMLLSTQRDPRGATDTGWLATIALPERPEPWHLLGQLLMESPGVNHLVQAHGALTRALALYPADHPAAIARLHDTLGRLLEDMKRPGEAAEHWLKAMGLHAAMRSEADTVHTDAASRAGLNAARMQALQGQHTQALQTLDKVLVWRRALAEREPTLMRQHDVATVLLNQNQSHQKLKQTCLGEAAWREARSIVGELAEIDPARFLERKKQSARPPLPPGTCQSTEASVLRSHTPLTLPTSAVLEALPAAEWKAQIEAWQDESRMQEGMAPAQSALAAQWSLAALGLQLRLAASEPDQHEQAVARTLTRIGSLHQMSGKPALALASYREALAAWGKVRGTRDAPRWLPDIVETLEGSIAHLQAKPSP
nr:carboxypeptidase-like regulatory domain-containing protein [uncultured Aquabacterium sp.]